MGALFGPAGTPEDFKEKGYKNSLDLPKYLVEMGLTAFEYQCGQGVRVGESLATELGKGAAAAGITLSLHAPYFISLSGVEKEKRDNSINYLLESARAADWMGARRIIAHSGSCGKLPREEALALAKDTLKRGREALVEAGYGHIHICPETMGKVNQLGDLDEVMELCLVDESFIPCIDFGHLNARTFGGLSGREAEGYGEILSVVENRLGSERLKHFHSHFSMIEYTEKGGEKRHLTFADRVYGPRFEPLMELVAKKGLSPTFICESAGTQGVDSAAMKASYMAHL